MKSIFRFLVMLLFSACLNMHPLFAQWVQTSGGLGTIYSLFANGTNLYAGGDSIFLSTNSGVSWRGVSSENAISFSASGSNLFACSNPGGVFLSTDSGASWTAVNSGLTTPHVRAIITSGSNVFAGTLGYGVFISTNNGTGWTEVSSGLPSRRIVSFGVSGTNLFAGSDSGYGVFLSTNNGANWTNASSGLVTRIDTYTSCFATISDSAGGVNLFAGVRGSGVFLSTNNGASWTLVSYSGIMNRSITSLAVSGRNLFAGTWYSGVFLSTNNGTNWREVNFNLTNLNVYSLAVGGENLFISIPSGVWKRPLSEIMSVERHSDDLSTHYSLEQNYPNPFNPSTTIQFSLPTSGHVSLRVFNLLGEEITTLVDEERPVGDHSVQWDGGRFASGVYFCRMTMGDYVETKKLLLMK